VTAIDCHLIARIARMAGAPIDKTAGIDLFAKIGSQMRAGDPLYRIHAGTQTGLDFARDLAADSSGYELR
jgi:thymidine phosphorylase